MNRRLLDMLAGWMMYLDKCVEEPDTVPAEEYEAEWEAVHAIYQRAGCVEDLSANEIHKVLVDHVIPLVMRGVQ